MRNVLVVDDEECVRELLVAMLEAPECQVIAAESGADALRLLRFEPHPDIVLLDHVMPGMNGVETLTAIRSQGVKAPVVFMTGMGTQESWLTTLEQGNTVVLLKPFTRRELRQKIQTAMRRTPTCPVAIA